MTLFTTKYLTANVLRAQLISAFKNPLRHHIIRKEFTVHVRWPCSKLRWRAVMQLPHTSVDAASIQTVQDRSIILGTRQIKMVREGAKRTHYLAAWVWINTIFDFVCLIQMGLGEHLVSEKYKYVFFPCLGMTDFHPKITQKKTINLCVDPF